MNTGTKTETEKQRKSETGQRVRERQSRWYQLSMVGRICGKDGFLSMKKCQYQLLKYTWRLQPILSPLYLYPLPTQQTYANVYVLS